MLKVKGLTFQQQDFFDKVIPLGVVIQNWTWSKCLFRNKVSTSNGIFASILIADMLLSSEWGEHRLAQVDFRGNNSNNLVLLEGENWEGKVNLYRGVKYRSYKNWKEFGIDWSDFIVWSDIYNEALICTDVESQAKQYSRSKPDPVVYNDKLIALIEQCRLWEIDNGKKTKR